MMTETGIVKFDFEGKPVRTVGTPDDPKWIAKDVCEVLELRGDPGQHTRRLEDDEKGLSIVQTLGGPQEMATVTESGLYALIFKSRKPVARRFRKWVTSEVLPEIRRKGYYVRQGDEARVVFALEQRIAGLLERVIELDNPQIRKCEAAGVRQRIKTIAAIRNGDEKLSKLVSFRRVDNELRGRVGYPVANGHRWESLPRLKLGDVLLALDEMEAEDMSMIRSKARQASKDADRQRRLLLTN